MSERLPLAPDAAMALGIASTAMPFARSSEAQAERWLRVLRLHGEAGVVLQALGVGESRLDTAAGSPQPVAARPVDDRDTVGQVVEQACRIAAARGVAAVESPDLLLAVMHVYGAHFDRVLEAHGTDRNEVIERLGVQTPA